MEELEFRGDPLSPPQPHVQAGGYSHKRLQQHKIEEMRHFFRDFPQSGAFVARYEPTRVGSGQDQKTWQVKEFLRSHRRHDHHTCPAPLDARGRDPGRLEPPAAGAGAGNQEMLRGRDRTAHRYLATAACRARSRRCRRASVDTLGVARAARCRGALQPVRIRVRA